MKKLLILLSFGAFLFAETPELERLKTCYLEDNMSCGINYARLLKEKGMNEESATVYLDLSLKGSYAATRELSKFYIYETKGIPQDCKKGVAILLNSVATKATKETLPSYMEISTLFKKGICLKQDDAKAKKYKDIYLEKSKQIRKGEQK